MKNTKLTKLFIFIFFGVLLFSVPAFAHGGMVGFGEGLFSVFLLVTALVLFLPSIFVRSPGAKVLIIACNIFFGFCALMSIGDTAAGLELVAAMIFGVNILWSIVIGILLRDKGNDDINSDEIPQDTKISSENDIDVKDEKGSAD